MNKFRITTDSGCDLSAALCESLGVEALRMTYTLNGITHTDTMGVEGAKEFFDALRAGAHAQTSQISPDAFLGFFRPFAQAGEPTVHISLGAAISGSCHNAEGAAAELALEHPGWECHVINSTQASAGYGLLVLKAAELRDAGASAEECARALDELKPRVNSIYTTDNLMYLHKGGRVSRTAAVFGTALNIIPILDLDLPGHLKVNCKERGAKNVKKRMLKMVSELVEDASGQTLIISHADAPEKAREYGEALKEECGFRDVLYTGIGSIIGTHTGPGLISVFFVGKSRV